MEVEKRERGCMQIVCKCKMRHNFENLQVNDPSNDHYRKRRIHQYKYKNTDRSLSSSEFCYKNKSSPSSVINSSIIYPCFFFIHVICSSVMASQNLATQPEILDCPKGTTGPNCQSDINECQFKSNCKNGHCINTHGSYHCNCFHGWEGIKCDQKKKYKERNYVKEVAEMKCKNNDCPLFATCKTNDSFKNGYECICPLGRKGDACRDELTTRNTNIDVVMTVQSYDFMSHHSKRQNSNEESEENIRPYDSSLTNSLAPGLINFTENSSISRSKSHSTVNTKQPRLTLVSDPSFDNNLCHGIQCLHGDCLENTLKGYPTCFCHTGWHGESCNLDTDECLDKNGVVKCEHNGHCINKIGAPYFECRCVEGWTGRNCERDVDECISNSNLCQHGSICRNNLGSFSCECKEGKLFWIIFSTVKGPLPNYSTLQKYRKFKIIKKN